MAILTVVSGAFAAPEVTIKVAAVTSGNLTETLVRSGSSVAYVPLAQAAGTTTPAFGFEAVAKDGGNPINGTWTLTSTTYTLRRNNVIQVDGAGNPIQSRQLGAFNLPGGAGPDINGYNAAGVQSVPNFTQSSGSTLNATSSIILSAHVIALGGSNRQLLAGYGDNYTMEYSMTGTFNGAPFAVSAKATVIIGAQLVWLDLRSNGPNNEISWSDGTSLLRDPAVTEEGNVTTDFVRGLRIAPTGVGKQYVVVGWESTTDLENEPWDPWNTTFPSGAFAPDGSGTLDVKAVAGRDGPYRYFRLKYTLLPGQGET
jgi:hypothetical protein